MAIESLASTVPVMTDLVLLVAEALSGKSLRAAFVEKLTERRHLIDHSTDPRSVERNLSLAFEGVEVRVTCDEAWWNDTELASSSVMGFVRVDARRSVSLWVEADRSIHWRGYGLTEDDVGVVTREVGRSAD